MFEMKLESLTKVPPGLFRYRHPVSGHEEAFHSWQLLRAWVDSHCAGNGFAPVTDEEIQQQICERMGPKIAKQYCTGDGVTVDGVSLGWKDILTGTKVLASFLLAGRPLVDAAEAERRAAICKTCSRNVNFAKPCGGLCGELQEAVEAIVGANGTIHDLDLGACSVCKCHLKSKCWIPLEILKKSESDEHQAEYPAACWLKTANTA